MGADGRCDLWIAGRTTTWGFEFKQATIHNRLTEAVPLLAMQAAMDCAKCLRSDEADERVAGLIVSLYWLDDEEEQEDAREALRDFAEDRDFAWEIPAPGEASGAFRTWRNAISAPT